ncbi:uncharacterized protein F5891DRAFT_1051531 [Suillus fuscotomentosus]|uniref:C2H2-type domain-containing protein n=1 Tax=Suillus fuscotomentosus TaxID=1912939 RepID=A0AAD4HI04_9AGAM|nr:uncharacterized protein F5891DRAFT_1051531 [Suillus fuscotomentosus]KAG1896891.1 hypothetical protein F5891DRAFT_1051531 [Suillus fuscotomentosus]
MAHNQVIFAFSLDVAATEPFLQQYHVINELFLCMWDDAYGLHCNAFVHGGDMATHLREAHGIRGPDNLPVLCRWEGCNAPMNKESLTRHVQGTHLGIRYPCNTCGRVFTRRYGLEVHQINCP